MVIERIYDAKDSFRNRDISLRYISVREVSLREFFELYSPECGKRRSIYRKGHIIKCKNTLYINYVGYEFIYKATERVKRVSGIVWNKRNLPTIWARGVSKLQRALDAPRLLFCFSEGVWALERAKCQPEPPPRGFSGRFKGL